MDAFSETYLNFAFAQQSSVKNNILGWVHQFIPQGNFKSIAKFKFLCRSEHFQNDNYYLAHISPFFHCFEF